MTAPILVALDTPTAAEAIRMAELVGDHVAGFKIGLELLMGPGAGLIEEIGSMGKPIFADAKLHDIPNTVEGAARQLGRAGARWVTVHASGGTEMMRAAAHGLREGSDEAEAGILAVTVLTSISDLMPMGVPTTTATQVLRLAGLATVAGVEGIVCAPSEVSAVVSAAPGLLTVVPGIRPEGVDANDQARTGTPAEAIADGADLLVIGRAITNADDPVAAVTAIAASIPGSDTSVG